MPIEKLTYLVLIHLIICSLEENEGREMYWQTGSSSIKVILDNSILVEPAQVVGNTGETTWCNLAHVFTLSRSGSNMMGISKQKLPNIYTYLDRAKKCTSLINSHLRKKNQSKSWSRFSRPSWIYTRADYSCIWQLSPKLCLN